jgi:hypothetical protein
MYFVGKKAQSGNHRGRLVSYIPPAISIEKVMLLVKKRGNLYYQCPVLATSCGTSHTAPAFACDARCPMLLSDAKRQSAWDIRS